MVARAQAVIDYKKYGEIQIMLLYFFNLTDRVITFGARVGGTGGGFSRITSGGGVFGGVGRSVGQMKY